MLATGSRAAFGSMMVGMLLVVLVTVTQKQYKLVIKFTVLLAVTVICIKFIINEVTATYLNKFIYTIFGETDQNESILYRIDFNARLLSYIFADYQTIILGNGPGRFVIDIYGETANHIVHTEGRTDFSISALMLYEYGIVGLILFYNFVSSLLVGLFRHGMSSKHSMLRQFSACLMGAIVSFIICEHSSARLESLFGFYVLCGIAAAIVASQTSAQIATRRL